MSKAVSVHRCRFAEYIPATIYAIAFSIDGSRLALARRDGNIEIWVVHDSSSSFWFGERIIINKEPVRSLVWTRANGEDRLFSSGLSGNIIEWDLTTSKKKYTTDSYAGPVWCLAADPAGNHLAAACDDGLRLFDISNGDIMFKKAFTKAGSGRTLSVSWNKIGDTLCTGGSDGLVRQWKLAGAHSTVTLRLAKVQSRCHIWAIAVLADETILTGDSRGVFSVWDPATTSEVYSLKSHDADVLAIAYSVQPDSGIVAIATGADSNMVCLRRTPTSGPGGYEWGLGGKFRHHKRDVFALAMSPGQIVASGGVDGSLHALPLPSLVQADKHPGLEMYAPLPPRPMVSFSASRGRFLYNGKPSVLEVWKAGQEVTGSLAMRASEQPGEPGLPLPIAEMPKLIARLQLKTGEKVISCALSPDGKMIACSDTLAVKLFRLDESTSKTKEVRVTKHDVPNAELAAWVAWLGDNYLVTGTFNGGLQLIDMLPTPSVVASYAPDWTRTSHAWTTCVATSSDKWVAAARPGGSVDVFFIDKSGAKPEIKFRGAIASLSPSSGVTVLAFQPNTNVLFGVRQGVPLPLSADKLGHQTFHFDVEAMSVVRGVQHQVPNHPYYDAVFDPSDTNRLMCVSPAAIVFSKLGARTEHTTVKSFGWVLHANFAKDGESVYVVERPPKHIAPKLPAPITHKRNYGKG